VLITLSTTFIMMPPLAFMLSRTGKRGLRLFATTGFRRGLAAAMVAVGTAFVVYSFIVAPQVKWRTNFREVRGKSENVDFTVYVERSLGGSLSPAGIFVENVVQARKVMAYLDPLTKSKNSGVQRAISLASMVPKDAAQKVKLIARMRRKLASIAHRKLEAKDRKNVDEALALVKTRPWTIDDVPRVFRRAFETVDGSGQFVVVWPRSEMVEDKEIIAWGKELDRIRSELRARDIPAMILGENRVGARVLQEMRDDAPTIIIAATIAVLLILITDTRSPRAVLLISGSLGVGILWMLGMMHLLDLQINVFNQAVLATVIGLGLDNAVHMQHRYAEEGHGSLPKVVATTGAASFLASATTAIGFGAAVIAHHGGIQSLGWLALVGFTSTFVSSTVFFPAVLRLLECASPLGCAETEWTDGVVQGAQKGSPDQGS
jgi:predicted RND superfamily exporter protein